MVQVQQFEQRKAQLSQRVTLIEQLRKGQTGPVHMLDQISRSLPPMLWLTELKQGGSGEVVVDGRCTTLSGYPSTVGRWSAAPNSEPVSAAATPRVEKLRQMPTT